MERNRPILKVKRVNKMREKMRNKDEFEIYVDSCDKLAAKEERQQLQRYVDDEQTEKYDIETI